MRNKKEEMELLVQPDDKGNIDVNWEITKWWPVRNFYVGD